MHLHHKELLQLQYPIFLAPTVLSTPRTSYEAVPHSLSVPLALLISFSIYARFLAAIGADPATSASGPWSSNFSASSDSSSFLAHTLSCRSNSALSGWMAITLSVFPLAVRINSTRRYRIVSRLY